MTLGLVSQKNGLNFFIVQFVICLIRSKQLMRRCILRLTLQLTAQNRNSLSGPQMSKSYQGNSEHVWLMKEVIHFIDCGCKHITVMVCGMRMGSYFQEPDLLNKMMPTWSICVACILANRIFMHAGVLDTQLCMKSLCWVYKTQKLVSDLMTVSILIEPAFWLNSSMLKDLNLGKASMIALANAPAIVLSSLEARDIKQSPANPSKIRDAFMHALCQCNYHTSNR